MKRFTSLIVAASLCVGVCNANPTDRNPKRALATHGAIDAAKAKTAELYSLYDKYEQLAIRSNEVKRDSSKLAYRELGKANGAIWQATREVYDLLLMGEPAAVDLRNKMAMLSQKIGLFTFNSGSSPKGAKYLASIIVKLKKQRPRRERDLAKLAQDIQQGRLDAADATAKRMGTELYSQVGYMSPSARKPYIQKFNELVGELNSVLKAKRRPVYQQQAMKKLSENRKLISGFATEIKRVSRELTAGGKVEIDEEDANHADAIRHLCDEWGVASSALIRNLALQWVFGKGKPSDALQGASKQAASVAAAARGAIVDTIMLAADSTPADQVEVVYGEILQALSFVDRRAAENVSSGCEAALSALVAKNPIFRRQVDAYRQATIDALKWRETFAQLQAKTLVSSYPDAPGVLLGTAEISQSNKPEVFGGTSKRKRPFAPKMISQPAAWAVFEAGSVLNSRRVSELTPMRLYNGSKTAVVPYAGSHYSNVRIELPIENQLKDLKRSLYVSEDHPPLTIEAAYAISSANWQDFEQVGGVISEVHLEGVATRFLSLPDIAYTISPLGRLPNIDDSIPVIEQACWRLNIEPHWARHKYFTVTIPQRVQVSTR